MQTCPNCGQIIADQDAAGQTNAAPDGSPAHPITITTVGVPGYLNWPPPITTIAIPPSLTFRWDS